MAQGRPLTVGGGDFDPDAFLKRWQDGELKAPETPDLESSIKSAFNLKGDDSYVYHAIASVTLGQVQQAISAGNRNGLHAWYLSGDGMPIDPPPQSDIEAYVSIFASTTSTSKALTGFASNAKKGSIRARVAQNMTSQRVLPSSLMIPKLKKPHVNPYYDFWAWSCKNLEWVGPDAETVNVRQSHHILPIFYHHFGCVCPSFESLETIRQLAKGRPVAELGSGNGYWTLMLRNMGLEVTAVDNGDSLWRTNWIGDTIQEDGARWLSKNSGAKDMVLLLVYPQVSTNFTKAVLKAYRGDTIAVAGTQNKNGFTAFKDETIDSWMKRELSSFQLLVQTPLPSFAAKDDALFVFQRTAA